MKTLLSLNRFAIIICFLFYLTCYLRFAGQLFLCGIQIISAITISIIIFQKSFYSFKNSLLIYWISTIINILILFLFFRTIMWNDFLQVLFVTIIPNITAIYFFRLVIKIENYENA